MSNGIIGITPSSPYETEIKDMGGVFQNITAPQNPTIYGTNFGSQMEDVARQLQSVGVDPTATGQDQSFLGGLFGGIGDFLGSTGGQQALGGLGGALLAQQAYQRLGDIGERARREASDIARQGLTQTEFRPFTVTTATGGMMGVGPEGGTTMAVSPEEQALQRQLLGGAGQFYGQAMTPTQQREQAIFERMRAAQRPEEERQRLALEERLAAQGRLGLSSAAYGGATPELLAQAQAQEEARSRAMLAAMQQAQAEQAQQAQLGGQLLSAGYVPQAQLIAATQPAMTTAQLAQRGQLEGAGLFGEAEMSGLEALLSSGITQANLMGQIGTGLLSQALKPTFVGGTGGATGGTGGGGVLGTGKSFSEFLDDVVGLDPSGGGLFRIFG
jgi:hypothetical protein